MEKAAVTDRTWLNSNPVTMRNTDLTIALQVWANEGFRRRDEQGNIVGNCRRLFTRRFPVYPRLVLLLENHLLSFEVPYPGFCNFLLP
jgi:hypothetical protein